MTQIVAETSIETRLSRLSPMLLHPFTPPFSPCSYARSASLVHSAPSFFIRDSEGVGRLGRMRGTLSPEVAEANRVGGRGCPLRPLTPPGIRFRTTAVHDSQGQGRTVWDREIRPRRSK